jgi:DNA-binding MarR family transcriptional regulator
MEMNSNQLTSAYKHCLNMLYNDSKLDPGRFHVLEEIQQQIDYCNTELAIRWFLSLADDKGNPFYTRFSLLGEINDKLNNIKNEIPKEYILRLEDFYDGLPIDFMKIPISLIQKGCKDLLGKFNRKHITKNFIIKQGIWFTKQEQDEFRDIQKLRNLSEIIKVIKDRLNLKQETDLVVKSTGLSYDQFRSMINLSVNKKYSELTSLQLKTLRDKILFVLEEDINYHISQWQKLMGQIEEVAEYKGITIK